MITVFTPTYNRGSLLSKLYESLLDQTFKDFEWLIIDDGSIDNTEEIVKKFILEKKLVIRYYKQNNQGKHIAINAGVNLSVRELFFIVDSDDILPMNSLELIVYKYNLISDVEDIAGVAGRRGYLKGGYIGTNKYYEDKIMTSLNFRYREKIHGDMAEVFKLNVIKKYPFPNFGNEKFCPEALIWQKIDQKYKMLWFSDIIYKGEYIDGGLTANIFKVRKKSPKATCLYYSELSKYNIPILQKIKAIANYWRFSIYNNIRFSNKVKEVSLFYTFIALPAIAILILKDKLR